MQIKEILDRIDELERRLLISPPSKLAKLVVSSLKVIEKMLLPLALGALVYISHTGANKIAKGQLAKQQVELFYQDILSDNIDQRNRALSLLQIIEPTLSSKLTDYVIDSSILKGTYSDINSRLIDMHKDLQEKYKKEASGYIATKKKLIPIMDVFEKYFLLFSLNDRDDLQSQSMENCKKDIIEDLAYLNGDRNNEKIFSDQHNEETNQEVFSFLLEDAMKFMLEVIDKYLKDTEIFNNNLVEHFSSPTTNDKYSTKLLEKEKELQNKIIEKSNDEDVFCQDHSPYKELSKIRDLIKKQEERDSAFTATNQKTIKALRAANGLIGITKKQLKRVKKTQEMIVRSLSTVGTTKPEDFEGFLIEIRKLKAYLQG